MTRIIKYLIDHDFTYYIEHSLSRNTYLIYNNSQKIFLKTKIAKRQMHQLIFFVYQQKPLSKKFIRNPHCCLGISTFQLW